MTSEKWRTAWEIYRRVQELPASERGVFLDSVSTDAEVLQEVVLLLDEPEDLPPEPDFQENIAVMGSSLSRYAVLAHLGHGSMGEIYSARDLQLGRTVALKFLAPGAIRSGAAERLIREAKTLSSLNHPNIVTVYEVIRSESSLAIVMELIEGAPLRLLCGAPLATDQLIPLGQQIARALAAAHAHDIVHRDIKPENILVRSDGYVKVVDFGLAWQAAADEPKDGFPVGTLRYMSPEQAQGESLTPASDIFSFGLVLYELATGQHPFASGSSLETAYAIATQMATPPSAVNPLVPQQLGSLIQNMLGHDPAARPSAQDVARALNALQTRPASKPSAARGKWIAAALLALVAGSVFIWRHSRATERQPAFYQVTTLLPENRATAVAISPDGRWTAYANVDGIFVRAMLNGETKALRAPGDFTIDRLVWFADGTKLVASGFSTETHVPSVWTISATGAEPRLVRTPGRQASPSPDGTRIAFVNEDRPEIWVVGANGEEPRKILDGAAGDTFPVVFWSANGRCLAFGRRHYSAKGDRPNRSLQRYYEQSYESMALDTGKVVVRAPDIWIDSAAVLPDGRMLFLKWDSPGSDAPQQLWQVNTDLTTGAFVGVPRIIAIPEGQLSPVLAEPPTIHDLSATADGRLAMVLKTSDQRAVFVGDFDPSPPRISHIRRLTLDERTSYPHAWTSDSRAVIFESNRNGSFDLFQQQIERRTAETIVATPLTEMLPQLSPDGRFVLYDARSPQSGSEGDKLMRVPVGGGTPQEVPIGGGLDEFRCPLRAGSRCVLRTTVRREYHIYYDLDPVTGKGRELARIKWIPGILGDWDVSPDGKYVAFPHHDSHEARIRVVALEPRPHDSREREVELKGLTNIRGLVWSADPDAWFVSVDTTVGNRLLYVRLDGRFQSLGDIQGWAVPSPDGRRVAFLDRILAANAWMIDRR
jgi:eukaryotic-like serine/threonine-protein kinase